MRANTADPDFLSARLHGRRGKIAEEERLENLCRIRTIDELSQNIIPDRPFRSVADFQRELVQALAGEVPKIIPNLGRMEADLVDWMLVRFHLENLKVRIRAMAGGVSPDRVREHLTILPYRSGGKREQVEIEKVETFPALIRELPDGLRQNVQRTFRFYGPDLNPFLLEAALDRGYFQELLHRAMAVSGDDREITQALVFQEIDLFHLMLVVRGKFYHGLVVDSLLPFHVPGTRITRALFIAMLADSDLLAAARRALNRAIDRLPSEPNNIEGAQGAMDPAALEACGWSRFLRLANRTFRRSNMGLGAVTGYLALRRIEVANLITLSEGIRNRLPVEAVSDRMLSPSLTH